MRTTITPARSFGQSGARWARRVLRAEEGEREGTGVTPCCWGCRSSARYTDLYLRGGRGRSRTRYIEITHGSGRRMRPPPNCATSAGARQGSLCAYVRTLLYLGYGNYRTSLGRSRLSAMKGLQRRKGV